MKKLVILLLLSLLCFSSGCSSLQSAKRVHDIEYRTNSTNPRDYGDNFDWQNRSPIDFLTLLKKRSIKHPYQILGIHKNWIKKSDIPHLFLLLDSTEPCAAVDMTISSVSGHAGSTVGDEAVYLINGFMEGEYPTDLSSIRFKLTQQEKADLKILLEKSY